MVLVQPPRAQLSWRLASFSTDSIVVGRYRPSSPAAAFLLCRAQSGLSGFSGEQQPARALLGGGGGWTASLDAGR